MRLFSIQFYEVDSIIKLSLRLNYRISLFILIIIHFVMAVICFVKDRTRSLILRMMVDFPNLAF